MQGYWTGKKVTVTGGAGFLGQHLVKRFQNLGAEVYVPRQRDYNLTTLEACLKCLLEHPADAIVLASEIYNDSAVPLNIGTGVGTTIRELSDAVCAASDYQGKMIWNADKPDGALKKVLDVTRMKAALNGWTPPTDLKAGLEKTVAWYRANKTLADAKW